MKDFTCGSGELLWLSGLSWAEVLTCMNEVIVHPYHLNPLNTWPQSIERPWMGQDRLSVKFWCGLSWVSGDRIGDCSLTLPITVLCQDEGQVDGEGGLLYQPASSLSSSHLHPSLVVCLSLPLSVSLFPSVSLYIKYILDIWSATIHCKNLWKILIIQIFLHKVYFKYKYIYIYRLFIDLLSLWAFDCFKISVLWVNCGNELEELCFL